MIKKSPADFVKKKYCCFQKIFLKTGPKYLLRGGKESNTFPGSDWAGDGSLQYRPNIHIRNENQGTNTYTSTGIEITTQIQIK